MKDIFWSLYCLRVTSHIWLYENHVLFLANQNFFCVFRYFFWSLIKKIQKIKNINFISKYYVCYTRNDNLIKIK